MHEFPEDVEESNPQRLAKDEKPTIPPSISVILSEPGEQETHIRGYSGPTSLGTFLTS